MENDPELMAKLGSFEHQIKGIQEQMQAVEEAILDMNSLIKGLEELKGKEGEEILARIGRGIFVKAKLLSEELVVDVGGKNFIKKDIPSTQEVIKDQLSKLNKIQEDLTGTLERMNEEITKTILDAQAKDKSEKKS
jgi:prefoldin alpha subunit